MSARATDDKVMPTLRQGRSRRSAGTERLLARTSIGPSSTVVFYGYAPALAFWLMKRYGHADVRVLDYARGAWVNDGRP
jgi:thiosulfate/3-mercaptopyruvate sulfurtransferase